MKTLTTLQNAYTDGSNNVTAANVARGTQYINDFHRYLLQKYFDNERSATTSTVGGMSLTLTGAPAINAVSATLTVAWAYPTVTQLVNFSGGQQRSVLFTKGSAAITWQVGLIAAATAAISSVGVQDYAIPANISKIKNDTITVGQLRYQPKAIMTREEWDMVNFLPYTSDIPNYFFIWNENLSIFPIPSTTGNILTFNYKTRVSDLTFADYSTGTIAAAGAVSGSVSVTGSATSWIATGLYPQNTDVTFYNLYIKFNPPYGDGIWYQISQFNSDTTLTLVNPVVNAPNITAATTYVIGQMPLLSEDFADMLVYGSLEIYYTQIKKDPEKAQMNGKLYADRLALLEDYAGTKQVDVDLEGEPQYVNPNLFLYAN